MPVYSFRCPTCGLEDELVASIHTGPGTIYCCDTPMDRIYHPPAVRTSWVPHYNHSVGRYVRTEAEFRSALSQASDDMSARTNIDHSYVPVEAGDREAMGVTDAGMDASRKAHRGEPGWENI